ncbi:hypothetical protein TNCV_2113551 [Trichonephila clavipes]|nr:hypothetical protein TNCV_2113551 [Trichonephila clavipes]
MYMGLMRVKFVEAQTQSRWCGVHVKKGGCQLKCHPSHLTMVQNDPRDEWPTCHSPCSIPTWPVNGFVQSFFQQRLISDLRVESSFTNNDSPLVSSLVAALPAPPS